MIKIELNINCYNEVRTSPFSANSFVSCEIRSSGTTSEGFCEFEDCFVSLRLAVSAELFPFCAITL